MLERLDSLLEQRADIVLETTLSSRLYARRIPGWKAMAYEVALIYLRLPDVDASIAGFGWAATACPKRTCAVGSAVASPTLRPTRRSPICGRYGIVATAHPSSRRRAPDEQASRSRDHRPRDEEGRLDRQARHPRTACGALRYASRIHSFR